MTAGLLGVSQEEWDARDLRAFEAAAPPSVGPGGEVDEVMLRITSMSVRDLRKELDERGLSVQVSRGRPRPDCWMGLSC